MFPPTSLTTQLLVAASFSIQHGLAAPIARENANTQADYSFSFPAAAAAPLVDVMDISPDSSSSSTTMPPPTSTTSQQSITSSPSPTTTWMPNFLVDPMTAKPNPIFVNPNGQNILISSAPSASPTTATTSTNQTSTVNNLPVVTFIVPGQTTTVTSVVSPSPTVYSTVTVSVTQSPVVVVVTSTLSPSQAQSPSPSSSQPAGTPAPVPAQPPAPAPPTADASKAPVVATYYPDWTADKILPEQVDFSRFDWVDFGSLNSPAISRYPN